MIAFRSVSRHEAAANHGEEGNSRSSRNPRQQQQQQQQDLPLPLSPSDGLDEEESLRQEEQQRYIRRSRLIVRPLVILLLGFVVFRNNYGNRRLFRGGLGSHYGGTRLRSRMAETAPNPEQHASYDSYYSSSKTVVKLPGSTAGGETSKAHPLVAKGLVPSRWAVGNPAISAYNIVTDMNDDDSTDDVVGRPTNTIFSEEDASPAEGGRESRHPGSTEFRKRASLPKNKDHDGTDASQKKKKKKKNGSDDDGSSGGSSSSYGWVPEAFPDPLLDPIRCGIAYLEQTDGSHATGATAEEERRGGLASGAGATPSQPQPLPQQLRLCDPDWVLGGVYLEAIAQKLAGFSARFTTGDLQPIPSRDDATARDSGLVPVGNPSSTPPAEPPPSSEQGLALAVATVRKMNIHAVLQEEQMFYAYGDDDDMVNDAAQVFARTLHNQWWENRNKNADQTNGDSSNENSDTTNGDAHESPPPAASGSNEEQRRRKEQEEFFHTGGWLPSRTATNHANSNHKDFGVLIFLSIQDRVCFISTGNAISTVLPWWRLEHIVASMKPDLRHRDYGKAVLTAIDDLSAMLEAGPPTFHDKMHDFLARFGVVIGFALFTFLFGAWGECRDRRKRWQYAESRSRLNSVDREKARLKQKEFQTTSCPICLEPFEGTEEAVEDDATVALDDDGSSCEEKQSLVCRRVSTSSSNRSSSRSSGGMVRVDSYGIPLCGADGLKVKFLRCGHIFCETCWKGWVHSGHGNPCICPVCRQDVGKPSSKNRRRKEQRRAARRARRAAAESARSSTASTATTDGEAPTLGANQSFGDFAFPTYGALSPAVDTRLSSSNDTTGGSSVANEGTAASRTGAASSRETGGGGLYFGGINVNRWVSSAFGPSRSSRVMNRDRSATTGAIDFAAVDESSWVD